MASSITPLCLGMVTNTFRAIAPVLCSLVCAQQGAASVALPRCGALEVSSSDTWALGIKVPGTR